MIVIIIKTKISYFSCAIEVYIKILNDSKWKYISFSK